MSERREKRKAEMLKKMETTIEELLDWEEATGGQVTFSQIEEKVWQVRQKLGEEMGRELLKEVSEREQGPGPACAQCGVEMRYKGRRKKTVGSRIGELKYERKYYVCEQCQTHVSPPRQAT